MRTIFGAILGGLAGYWFRPSVPLLGQLPFEAMATRGESLRDLAMVLKGIAQQSFNYIVGIILGAIACFELTPIGSAGNARTIKQYP